MVANTTPEVGAAREQVAQFVDLVFEPDDLVEVRCLRENSRPWRRWVRAAEVVDLVPELARLNADGWNVYAGANPRSRDGGGSDADVALARCLFVDFDDCGPAGAKARIEAAGLPTPTLVLDSGNGAHAYWRLEEPLEDLETWADYQRAAIAAVGSDPTIKNPSRIMRVPGFENLKPEKDATLAQVFAYVEDEPHALEDLGLVPAAPEPLAPGGGPPIEVGERSMPHPIVVRFLRYGETGDVDRATGEVDGRRRMIFLAACDLAARGWSPAEVELYVARGAARAGFVDTRYVRGAVRSAFSKPRDPWLHEDDFLGACEAFVARLTAGQGGAA